MGLASAENPAADAPESAKPSENSGKKSLPEIPLAIAAVVACQEDLNQALSLHKQWVDAVLDPNCEVASGRANFSGMDLTAYNLSGAELRGANLQACNLTGVDLSLADLSTADLRGARLANANLQGAKLIRAKIDGADLRGADLTGANIKDVDLNRAILRSTPSEPAT